MALLSHGQMKPGGCRAFFLEGFKMSAVERFHLRDWIVPPIVVPLFLGLLIVAAIVIQW